MIVLLVGVLGVAVAAFSSDRVASRVTYLVKENAATLISMVDPIDDRPRVGAAAPGFNVLLVVLDACRPDKIGAYGFDRNTTPALDRLAEDPDAVVFLRHFVQATWTKPSTASLFTGLYPHEHGVVAGHLAPSGEEADRRFRTQALLPEYDTMAELMNKAGFYTFAVVTPNHVNPENGFAQGFAEFHGILYGGDETRLRTVTALAEAVEGNFFGYTHLLACHAPFPEQYRHPQYMSEYGFGYDEEDRRSKGIDFTTYDTGDQINAGEVELTEDDARFLHLVYEARMRWTDENLVAPLVQSLKESGLYDDTLLIVTADHGEELYDHGGFAHGHALWNEVIHVPLIVKYPKGQKPQGLESRVMTLTSAVDVLPSLLALTGQPERENLRGAPSLTGASSGYAFSENPDCRFENIARCHLDADYAVMQGDWKLIKDEDELRLFNLKSDPLERRDLHAQMMARISELTRSVAQLKSESRTAPVQAGFDLELNQDKIEHLRSLGYIQ